MAPRGLRRCCRGLGLVIAASSLATAASAQPKPLDVQVKAAFLPKFAAYVNWPPGSLGAPDNPLLLCVIGRDPFGPHLDAAAIGQHVDQHPLQVRRVESTTAVGNCDIAFLGGSARQSTAVMVEALRGQPILTVTDANAGDGRGIVHFALKDGRVRFHIDDAAAARNNLSLSARLLSLALSVKPRGRLS